jgi:Yip1 domain
MGAFLYRVMGSAVLDAATYEEIEGNKGVTSQAFLIVLLASLAAGIGLGGLEPGHPVSFAFVSILALMTWAIWSVVIFHVGGSILPEPQTRVDVGELLRTLGFAATPALFQVFGVVPGLRGPLFILTSIWMLAAMVVAVRQALDYSTVVRALAVCAIGWVLAFGTAILLGVIYGPTLS